MAQDRRPPFRFAEVFRAELARLRPELPSSAQGGIVEKSIGAAAVTEGPRGSDDAAYWQRWDRATQDLYRAVGEGEEGLSALCLSGGGIRSATFNLGVLQEMARRGLLGRFDYLSTVSGGGFIGGWLAAWMTRSGPGEVLEALGVPEASASPHATEPKPIDHLREYSNYLTPSAGLFSPDWWAAIATVARNIFLNWLVVLPAMAAVMTLPHAVLALAEEGGARHGEAVLVLAFAFGLLASVASHRLRLAPPARGAGSLVVALAIAPILLAAACLSYAVWARPAGQALWAAWSRWSIWGVALAGTVGIPVVGWLAARISTPAGDVAATASPRARGSWPGELAGLVVSGLLAGGLVVLGASALDGSPHPGARAYAVLAVPILLLLYWLARTIFAAFSGEADGEWWARVSGLVLLGALAWAALAGAAAVGFVLLEKLWATVPSLATAWLAAGGATSLVGKSAATASGRGDAPARSAAWVEKLLMLGAAVALAAVFVLLGQLDSAAVRALVCSEANPACRCQAAAHLGLGVALLLFALLASVLVNVNRFSLHGLYRNRLTRAYLGASNPRRRPNPFTGFDPGDDLPLHEIQPGPARPLPVLNATLNLVAGSKLAWQERKGESFSMSPLFCGNFHDGYRATETYGGRSGISLATAMTISGAAANPSMGYFSSPLVTFVMALFDARLGAWLPNTGDAGDGTFRKEGPGLALGAMVSELLGRTDNRGGYVNLSDGGHFDNLGLYEMVLRRCRWILVCDAGCDPESGFADLGNAIRKIRIDFGVPIEFPDPIQILPRSAEAGAARGTCCAVGMVRYSEVDGPDVKDGVLLYLKPTIALSGRPVPYDVRAYAGRSKDFPHEPTADQWFSESQFESYRALGQDLLARVTEGVDAGAEWSEVVEAIRRGARPA